MMWWAALQREANEKGHLHIHRPTRFPSGGNNKLWFVYTMIYPDDYKDILARLFKEIDDWQIWERPRPQLKQGESQTPKTLKLLSDFHPRQPLFGLCRGYFCAFSVSLPNRNDNKNYYE